MTPPIFIATRVSLLFLAIVSSWCNLSHPTAALRRCQGQREAQRIQDAVMPCACSRFAVCRFGHLVPRAAHPAAIVAEKVYASAATGSKQEFFRHSKVTECICAGFLNPGRLGRTLCSDNYSLAYFSS
jgi:hypothetical protein